MSIPSDGGGPAYPPGMQPVWFPTATAHAAIAACRRAAALVTVDLEQRPSWVSAARADWSGPHRREFDTGFAAQQTGIHDLKERLDRLALAIEDAIANVGVENRLRATQRAEYDQAQAAVESGG